MPISKSAEDTVLRQKRLGTHAGRLMVGNEEEKLSGDAQLRHLGGEAQGDVDDFANQRALAKHGTD